MTKKTKNRPFCSVLSFSFFFSLFLAGCQSPTTLKLQIVHLQNARNAVQHNARMRCLEQAKAKAYTAHDQGQVYGGSARDYASPEYLDSSCFKNNY